MGHFDEIIFLDLVSRRHRHEMVKKDDLILMIA